MLLDSVLYFCLKRDESFNTHMENAIIGERGLTASDIIEETVFQNCEFIRTASVW